MKKVCISVLALILLVCFASAASAVSYAPINLADDQRYAMNLFLSNFTEIGIDEISIHSEDMELVDFAHDHMWFNSHDSYEYGEYFNDNNCRVSDDRIQSIIEDYFYTADDYFHSAGPVDLSKTRYDYDGEYYYHCETGGWSNCGFAQTISACNVDEDQYFISFMVFADGESWENDALSLSIDAAAEKYGAPCRYGHALVYAADPADRATYRMILYCE